MLLMFVRFRATPNALRIYFEFQRRETMFCNLIRFDYIFRIY